ncbi:MAG: hypothetical protein BZY88_01540 [SAR202 cluster bacterium Io17-Chloro-G9]|nr:MAG: hypothetical protein BZY88_01540 [SAR202 cluster bacterium Io17-Chloro-G9]
MPRKPAATRSQPRSWSKPGGLAALVWVILLLAACGGTATPGVVKTTAPEPVEATAGVATEAPPVWRFVNSGWAELTGGEKPGAFTEELRAFVITSQDELDAFDSGFTLRRSRGTQATLGRAEFSSSVLLAAYYLWRPVQGDPLSVVGFSIAGNKAIVRLQLADSAQGKLYPYPMAPMTMVAVGKALFPNGEPVEFQFMLNGEQAATVVATVQ